MGECGWYYRYAEGKVVVYLVVLLLVASHTTKSSYTMLTNTMLVWRAVRLGARQPQQLSHRNSQPLHNCEVTPSHDRVPSGATYTINFEDSREYVFAARSERMHVAQRHIVKERILIRQSRRLDTRSEACHWSLVPGRWSLVARRSSHIVVGWERKRGRYKCRGK